MRSFRTYWFLTTIVLSFFTFNGLSEAKHEKKKLPSAVVVGTVYCDTCFQADFSKTSHFISGALVAVECGGTSSKPSFREEVKTNEQGEFKIHLPFSVSKHVKNIKGCSVKLISSSEPYCAVASTAASSSLRLKSRKQGTHIFSAGFFTFKPLKQPTLCNQKPSFQKSKEFNSQKPLIPFPDNPTFPPPIQDPPTLPILPPIDQNHLPPLPQLPSLPPLPQLPPMPPLPGIPYFPPPAKKSMQSKFADTSKASKLSNGKVDRGQFFQPIPQNQLFPTPSPSPSPPTFGIPLPPNPFRPPSVLPPNPFRPPPSVFPPNPFQPLPPLINAPPLPNLTPSPPPSTPPAFPIPLPPFPFQPSPGFPGIPPAFSSSSSKKTVP
ncbi:hypothetical protein CsSME_00004063 [Camellia sinensis var. sinensis]|uniref:Pollen Ole e 1 allergen and extensin family protein n=1 Tax=Camellia sinensis TaxID=4442 RepID=A0A7J7I8X0_CAMSI|nr:hypothetical protein HYC85_002641 [Camellia sinensis]